MASMLSSLLDLLLPFENLGVLHPYLATSHNILDVEKRMLLNIEQTLVYTTTYCAKSKDAWCPAKIKELKEFKIKVTPSNESSSIINS